MSVDELKMRQDILDLDNDTISTNLYQILLESTKAIPWMVNLETTEFIYIGPQIEELLGWPQTSWKNLKDWADRMHEDDRNRIVKYCYEQSKAGVDHEADYRALKENGDFMWIHDVVRVIRTDDDKVFLLGFMFDITKQKNLEMEYTETIKSLNIALDEVKLLKGIITICSYCHGIKDDEETWERIERYLSRYSKSELTHGICPKCATRVKSEFLNQL